MDPNECNIKEMEQNEKKVTNSGENVVHPSSMECTTTDATRNHKENKPLPSTINDPVTQISSNSQFSPKSILGKQSLEMPIEEASVLETGRELLQQLKDRSALQKEKRIQLQKSISPHESPSTQRVSSPIENELGKLSPNETHISDNGSATTKNSSSSPSSVLTKIKARSILRKELRSNKPDISIIINVCKLQLSCIPDELRSEIWQMILNVTSQDRFLIDDSIQATTQDLENQRVIKVDAERTRADMDEFRSTAMHELISKLLTFYCKQHHIKYKQGLNEVLAPFLILRKERSLPDGVLFSTFQAFIQRYLTHMYNDEDFVALQCEFQLFRLLLQYHDTELYNWLDKHFLSPELYATPWFLTLFARNVPIELLFRIWDTILLQEKKKGQLFPIFMAIAFVCSNRSAILKAHSSDLPILLAGSLGSNSVPKPRTTETSPKNSKASDAEKDIQYLTVNTSCTSKVKTEEPPLRGLHSKEVVEEVLKKAQAIYRMTPTEYVNTASTILYSKHPPPHDTLIHLENQISFEISAKTMLTGFEHATPASPTRTCSENGSVKPSDSGILVLDCRERNEYESVRLSGPHVHHVDPKLIKSPDKLRFVLVQVATFAGENWEYPTIDICPWESADSMNGSFSNTFGWHFVIVGQSTAKHVTDNVIRHMLELGFKRVSTVKGGWEQIATTWEELKAPNYQMDYGGVPPPPIPIPGGGASPANKETETEESSTWINKFRKTMETSGMSLRRFRSTSTEKACNVETGGNEILKTEQLVSVDAPTRKNSMFNSFLNRFNSAQAKPSAEKEEQNNKDDNTNSDVETCETMSNENCGIEWEPLRELHKKYQFLIRFRCQQVGKTRYIWFWMCCKDECVVFGINVLVSG